MPAQRRSGSRKSPAAARAISEELAKRIGQNKYDRWFGRTRLEVQGSRVEVATDSQFVARWIDSHFVQELRGIAQQELGDEIAVKVKVKPGAHDRDADNKPKSRPATKARAGSGRDGARRTRRDATSTSVRMAPFRRLTDFLVGPCNELALAAGTRLAEDPGASVISPLFIHGECGVGKTHLLQGICQRFAEATGGRANVRYVTGEQFTNEFLAALRNREIDAFRQRMRELDLLAIDDVHFLSNKVRTQGEFLHTLDAIGLGGARIVLAASEHPRRIKRFSQALVSRFLAGMVVKIDRPDRVTRLELIGALAKARGLKINDAAAEAVAANCVGSVRELEGAVTKLAALQLLAAGQSLNGRKSAGEVGLALAEQLFKDHGWQPATPVRIGTVIEVVCERLGVSRNDLMGSGRHRRVVMARALVAHLGRELTTLSYPEIAQALGRSYHSTVHTAAQRLRKQLAADEGADLGSGESRLSLRELTDQLRHEIRRATSRGE